jgi:hypothetical protein
MLPYRMNIGKTIVMITKRWIEGTEGAEIWNLGGKREFLHKKL